MANDDDEHLENVDISSEGRIFNIFWFALLVFLSILTQYLLLVRYRHHQMFLVRFPKVFWLDITLNFLNGAVQTAYNLDFFSANVGCEPFASLSFALDVVSNTALIGRAVLFYNQAANIGQVKRIPIIDQVLYIIGCLTAPGEFFRYSRDNQYTSTDNSKTNDVVPISADSSSPQEKRVAGLRQQLSIRKVGLLRRLLQCNGFTHYLYVNLCWYILAACLTMNFTTLQGLHSHATDASYAGPVACWSAYLLPMQVGFYYGYSAVYIVILIAISRVQDHVGLRDDIAFSLVIGVGFKFVNGFLLQFWASSWVYTYSPAAAAPPLISMIVLLIYIQKMDRSSKHQHDAKNIGLSTDSLDEVLAADDLVNGTHHRPEVMRVERSIRSNSSRQSSKASSTKPSATPNSNNNNQQTRMERYWNFDEGKKIIEELGKKFFVHESIRFLTETDELLLDQFPVEDDFPNDNNLPNIGTKHINSKFVPYMKLFETFIEANSPWEVNISSKMRDHYARLLTELDDEGDPHDNIRALINLIIVIRREIFIMIDPILRTHLKQLYQHLKASSATAMAVGGEKGSTVIVSV